MRLTLLPCFVGVLALPVAGCGPVDAPIGATAEQSAMEAPAPSQAEPPPPLEAYGQIIYVPAYSHIYHVRQDRDFQLTVTLSIRNPFPWRTLTINRVDYFDSSGAFVRSYLHDALTLDPLETLEFVVDQSDESGGSGANFLIGWEGAETDAGPITEAVMIGTASGQGLSFATTGTPVRRD